jgi:hypothetical protein
MRNPLIAAASLAIGVVATAAAQSPAPPPKLDPADVRALTANYELTNADSTQKCAMTLDPRPVGRGLTLAFDRRQCASLFGFLGEVSAWLPGVAGAILFIAPDGRTIAEFTEGVGGVYEAIRENDGVYFLANLQFVDPSERVQAADLFGEWVLSRPDGKATCRVTLTDEVAGNELYAARVNAECDPAIAKLGINQWRLERGDVLLRVKSGDPLRFGRQESGIWMKIPEKPQPLLLSRPQ